MISDLLCEKKGYSYLAVYGGYHEDGAEKPSVEKSFVVYPYDIYLGKHHDWDKFYADMIEIGKSYNQDSILVCPPGGLRDMFTLIQRERRILLMTLNILM